jgi:transposase-like protein
MTENGEVVGRKRRSSQEVQRLVTEFESSGLRQSEFCRKEGLGLGTLRRQLKRRQLGKWETNHSGRLVRVELAQRNRELNSPVRSGLEVVLSNGRKIAVWPDFDSGTLQRLVGALEKV